MDHPTLDQILNLLHYDTETGDLYWKNSGRGKRNTIAGNVTINGYRNIYIAPKRYGAHRLVWLMHYGQMPEQDIDHINGNRLDNRVENLRKADRSQNAFNQKKSRKNTSGIKGVTINKWGRFRAVLYSYKAKIHIGMFGTLKEAEMAIKQARLDHHGSFSNNG